MTDASVAAVRDRVLVLDDDETVLEYFRLVLPTLGVEEILTAHDGEEGLSVLAAHAPWDGVLICDLSMPKMDGFELLQKLIDRHFAGEIIFTSGVNQALLSCADLLARAHSLRVLGCLKKPISPSNLAEILRRPPG